MIACAVLPTEAAVFSVTQVHAGESQPLSITSSKVSVAGSMRTLNIVVQKQLQLRLKQVLHSQSSSCSCSASLDWRLCPNSLYPVLVNDFHLSEMASLIASIWLENARVTQLTPYIAAESFAFYAQVLYQLAPVLFSTLET